MNETLLRWKARIGSLKVLSFIVFIIACILILAGGIGLQGALMNPEGAREITVAQLVNGDLGSNAYVTVSGIPEYDFGYEETEDGRTTHTYYYLVDYDTRDMILIQHHSTYITYREPGRATITGMTHSPASDLRNLIEEDQSYFTARDLNTTASLYLHDGEEPMDLLTAILMLGGGVAITIPFIVPFFFRNQIFAPFPVDPSAPRPEMKPEVKASGRFIQLKQIEPTIEIAKRGLRKFTNATANILTVRGTQVMIYIHYIARVRGVPVSKTHWALFLDQNNVIDIVPGKIYGWKDRWGVEITYHGPKDKPETLRVIFKSPGAQADFVELLSKMGFQIAEVT